MEVHLVSLLLVFAAGLIITAEAHSILGDQAQSQEANYFVTSYPKNGQFAALSTIRLHVTTTDPSGPVSFTVSNPSSSPLMSTFTGSVSVGQTVTVPIPYQLTMTSINDINKAIYIQAEGNKTIRVYSSNYVATSADAFTVLPLHQYDAIDTYTYYVISTETQINNRFSAAVLVSGTQATNVTVTPTLPITLPPEVTGLSENIIVQPNEMYTFTMSPLQTVLVRNARDISGTKIESTQPIAVIASHQCGMVPNGLQYCDYLVHQIPPVNTWGSNFMSLPFPSGSVYKMIPAANDTSIIITCGNETKNEEEMNNNNQVTSLGPLSSGEWIEHAVLSNNTWCSIVSNGPILTVQLARGGQQMQIGDPMSLVLTPIEQYTLMSSPLAIPQSLYQTNLNQIIGINAQIFVPSSANVSQLQLSLDNTPILNTNWTSIYSGGILTGYATKVTGLSNSPHILSSSFSAVPMGISIYGYSNNDAYSYPLNGGLNSLSSFPSPLQVEFPRANYTLIEGEHHMIPIRRQNMLDEGVSLAMRGCNGTSLPSNVIMHQTLINFGTGDQTANIELSVTDDREFSDEECFCAELVQPGLVYTFLHPYALTTMCIRDNEDIRVEISSAIVNEDLTQIDLTLTLIGYHGNTDMMITVQPEIITDQLEQQVPSLSLFNVYFTKYLTTSTYTLTLSDAIPSNSLLLLTSMDNRFNISSEPIPITFPPSPLPPLPSSTLIPSSIIIVSSPSYHLSSSYDTSSISTSTNTPTVISSTALHPTVTLPPTDSLAFFSNSSNIILLVLSVALLVLLVITLSFCVATVHLIKVRKNSKSFDLNNQSQWKLTDVESSITNSQMSITKRTSNYSCSSSESQDPHHVVIDTNSPPNSSCHNSVDHLYHQSPV